MSRAAGTNDQWRLGDARRADSSGSHTSESVKTCRAVVAARALGGGSAPLPQLPHGAVPSGHGRPGRPPRCPRHPAAAVGVHARCPGPGCPEGPCGVRGRCDVCLDRDYLRRSTSASCRPRGCPTAPDATAAVRTVVVAAAGSAVAGGPRHALAVSGCGCPDGCGSVQCPDPGQCPLCIRTAGVRPRYCRSRRVSAAIGIGRRAGVRWWDVATAGTPGRPGGQSAAEAARARRSWPAGPGPGPPRRSTRPTATP
jgi:hypothetical protein